MLPPGGRVRSRWRAVPASRGGWVLSGRRLHPRVEESTPSGLLEPPLAQGRWLPSSWAHGVRVDVGVVGGGCPAPSPSQPPREAGGPRGLRRSGGSCRFQQWRLLPYLAATWALDHFSRCLFLALRELQLGFLKNDRSARQVRTRLPSAAAEAAALKFLGPNSIDAAIPLNQPQCLLGLRGGDPVRPLSWAVARTCQACVHVPASQGCADMAPASCL